MVELHAGQLHLQQLVHRQLPRASSTLTTTRLT
jgi:hypothetical protein